MDALMTSSTPASAPRPVIWRVMDDKAGHRNQVLGLCDSLSRLIDADFVDVPVDRQLAAWKSLLPGRLQPFETLPSPTLLVGAGHSVHLPMLRLQRRFGGKTVVLMKPSLPMAWFDLSFIASVHNITKQRDYLEITDGPLNRIRPSNTLENSCGLVLIGGPSDHFEWSDADVMNQLTAVLSRSPGIEWTLTTSRRTPKSFIDMWHAADLPGQMFLCEHTPPGWLQEQAQYASTVWVTCESMSMVYEALTAGASVGLFDLEPKQRGRVFRSVQGLIDAGRVRSWADWNQGKPLPIQSEPFCEADRCAEIVSERFFAATPAASDRFATARKAA